MTEASPVLVSSSLKAQIDFRLTGGHLWCLTKCAKCRIIVLNQEKLFENVFNAKKNYTNSKV